MLSIRAAEVLAVALIGAGMLTRRTLVGRVAREAGVVFALYAVWQLLLNAVVVHSAGAVARGRWILDVERWLPLPTEATFQRWFLPYRGLVRFANGYYAIAHYPDVIAMLIFLFFWHPERYRWGRWLLIIATAFSVPLQG